MPKPFSKIKLADDIIKISTRVDERLHIGEQMSLADELERRINSSASIQTNMEGFFNVLSKAMGLKTSIR